MVSLVYLLKPDVRICRHPIVAFGIALVCAASGMLTFKAFPVEFPYPFLVTCEIVSQLGGNLLLLLWGEALLPYGLKRLVLIFSFACSISAASTLVFGSIRLEMEGGVLTTLPVISTICLYFFTEFNTSRNGFSTGNHGPINPILSDLSGITIRINRGTLTTFLLFLILVRLCLGHATTNWILVSEESGANLSSQICSSVGMLLAGAIVLLVALSLGADSGVRLYPTVIVFVLVGALLAVFALDKMMPWISIVLVVAEQLLLILPAFVIPYLVDVKSGQPSIFAEVLVLAACSTGSSIGAALQAYADRQALAVTLVCTSMALFVISLFFCKNLSSSVDKTASFGATSENDVKDTSIFDDTFIGSSDDIMNTCKTISEYYHLTKRENDILTLLVMRYTNEEISKTLMISMATVRTHIRNIYAKLDIHSVKDLRNLYNKISLNRKGDRSAS